MIAQFIQNLVHLERRQDRLDQHGRANRPPRNSQPVLREAEDIIPQPRFQMALHLRQIEVRAGALANQFLRVVEEEQPEIEQRRRDRLAIDQEMSFVQMPAARPHQQRRRSSDSTRSACPSGLA